MARGAPKGHKKWGGRAKGVPNKLTSGILERALAIGRDPLDILFLFANNKWEELRLTKPINAELMKSAASDAANYIYAKKRAVEHSGEIGTPEPKIKEESLEDRVSKLKGE